LIARAIEVLSDHHDRSNFSCGKPPLDDYIRKFASQNQRTGYGRHFVAVQLPDRIEVDAYYSLAMGSVAFVHAPPPLLKRCPKYPIPVAHLARLAVDQQWQGEGLGSMMLADAIERIALAAEVVACRAIEVIAIDGEAKAWYERFGFQPLLDSPLHLYLPMDTARKLIEKMHP
jgi:ribosomal protein S18 acetylase RimI-like enzyme